MHRGRTPPEERELLEDHMAAAVGLVRWAAEQGLGEFPQPRDSLEQYAQQHADRYRALPRRHVH
jgi:hypothetical protein